MSPDPNMSALPRLKTHPMMRISIPYFYELSSALEPLASMSEQDTKFELLFMTLFNAQSTLRVLVTESIYASVLRTSYQLSQTLMGSINSVTADFNAEKIIQRHEIWIIKHNYSNYKTALLAELGVLNSYFVTQHGGYDMHSLLNMGELLFPPDLLQKVPEAISDVREAAKSLAFEVPTACGFHVFRATESVLRKYHSHVTGGAAPPKVRSMGVYLNSLKIAKKGDAKVLAVLKQMIDLHRNPLIHPEVVLTTIDAIATLGIARSAITAMLVELPVIPATTLTSIAAP